jgi:hypothetical protein
VNALSCKQLTSAWYGINPTTFNSVCSSSKQTTTHVFMTTGRASPAEWARWPAKEIPSTRVAARRLATTPRVPSAEEGETEWRRTFTDGWQGALMQQQSNLPTKKVRTCKLLAGGKGWQGSLSPAHMTSSWARSPSAAGRALPVDLKLIGIAASVHTACRGARNA